MMNRAYKIALFIFFLNGVINLAVTVLAQDDSAGDIIVRPVVEYKSEQLRDPFKAYVETEGRASFQSGAAAKQPELNLSKFIVQGIIWGGKMPQAIINNKVFNIGDSIEGAVIMSIDKTGISLSYGEKIYDLAAPGKKLAPRQAN